MRRSVLILLVVFGVVMFIGLLALWMYSSNRSSDDLFVVELIVDACKYRGMTVYLFGSLMTDQSTRYYDSDGNWIYSGTSGIHSEQGNASWFSERGIELNAIWIDELHARPKVSGVRPFGVFVENVTTCVPVYYDRDLPSALRPKTAGADMSLRISRSK